MARIKDLQPASPVSTDNLVFDGDGGTKKMSIAAFEQKLVEDGVLDEAKIAQTNQNSTTTVPSSAVLYDGLKNNMKIVFYENTENVSFGANTDTSKTYTPPSYSGYEPVAVICAHTGNSLLVSLACTIDANKKISHIVHSYRTSAANVAYRAFYIFYVRST